MAFNSQWNEVYRAKTMGLYPDTAFVRFVARNFYQKPNRKEVKFLDVGCGAGGNTWYLSREGFSVAGIDGSIIAINRIKERLEAEKLEAMLACADISSLVLKEGYFDCIFDVCSLCYVSEQQIPLVMVQLRKVLKPGGKFFSITPTDECDPSIFNHVIDGVDLQSRFLRRRTIGRLFDHFKEVDVKPYIYDNVKLWEVQAVK